MRTIRFDGTFQRNVPTAQQQNLHGQRRAIQLFPTRPAARQIPNFAEFVGQIANGGPFSAGPAADFAAGNEQSAFSHEPPFQRLPEAHGRGWGRPCSRRVCRVQSGARQGLR